jgi:hypothetical protein
MKRFVIAVFLILAVIQSKSQTQWINVKSNGADATGKIKCTGLIKHLIDSISNSGGGTVYFPAGIYYTGPIVLRSNITLYVDAGATIEFSDEFDDYLPMVQTRWEELRVRNFISQIYAYQCENIAIRGDGHFKGNGQKWWEFWNSVKKGEQSSSKWQKIFKEENADLLLRNEYLHGKNAFLRPPMLLTYECRNVLIEGVSFSDPPFWTLVPTFSDNITIEGITIDNPGYSPNTDGIDISSCTNVHISNSHISVGDDCIVIKSGRDEDGREANRPTENVTVTNCTMLKGHGGVVIGSEMSGNVKRIAISNCIFEGTDVGIRIKTMRGRGGIVEDIRVSNVLMYNMVKEGVIITMQYQPTDPELLSERTPTVRNVHLSGIIVRQAERAIAIYGLEEKDVSQVTFSDMQLIAKTGILIENASDISFHDIRMDVREGVPFEARDAKQLVCDRFKINTVLPGDTRIKLINCQAVRITNNYQDETIPVFLDEDESCDSIYFINNILPNTEALSNNKGTHIFSDSNIRQ